jgi:hypothetical protein
MNGGIIEGFGSFLYIGYSFLYFGMKRTPAG